MSPFCLKNGAEVKADNMIEKEESWMLNSNALPFIQLLPQNIRKAKMKNSNRQLENTV